MDDKHISLAHGNGGRFMRELIEEIFARHLGRDELDTQADAVPIALNGGEVLITTDGFTVQPLEFPGGDIGSLAVHGTTNDLAVAGAITPLVIDLTSTEGEPLGVRVRTRPGTTLGAGERDLDGPDTSAVYEEKRPGAGRVVQSILRVSGSAHRGLEIHPAILGPTGSGVVGGNGVFFSITIKEDAIRINTFIDQVPGYGLGP